MLYGAKYEALVDAVKGHIVRNYEKDGWDYIVDVTVMEILLLLFKCSQTLPHLSKR